MSHVRQQIRDDVRTKLVALGLECPKGRLDFTRSQLPAADLSTGDETSERITKDGTLLRRIEVAIVLVLDADTEDLDDELDTLAARVETKLSDEPPAVCMYFDLVATETDLLTDEDGDRWFGYKALLYQAVLTTPQGDPESVLN